ncbi:sulfatase-like hydrolase/transferase [Rhodopirellula sp. P2]|uniref:sulfatase-like hydrolase/transferase n=1 Tax=Rhodopirellula sp. P2 TaxID=2127060 RepID=UPI0023683B63|nr:sulfatase-like hydrolase/transferase [Rhodopirellula sp. P2]WDQ14885.1 sulfatase-like hydrolase/transferase [Rhodopirellula sp. P2]
MNLLLRCLIVCSLLCASTAAQSSERPNIILILADDMGPGEPSHAGGLIPTPALDQLAEQGMRFTDAHTSSSVCTPTRYGILTGRYNWRSRLKRGVLVAADSPALMDPKRLSLPTFLQQAGYHTACIGKWHLGADFAPAPAQANSTRKAQFGSWNIDYEKPFRNGPVDVGFDEAFFILSSLDMPPYVYLRNDQAEKTPTLERGFPHNEYNDFERIGATADDFDASECLANWAAESRRYIQRQATQGSKTPFFLYLPLTSPHTPIRPGKAFRGRYQQYSWYADFIAETDWVVGQVLEQLQESGIDQETLVIFTSDNGFAPYVKIPKMLAAGYHPSGPYRGSKGSLYEGGHRVPFLVRWPGHVAPGSSSDTTICTTDFFATFAEILGESEAIPENAAEDSFSFASSMQGKATPTRPQTIHHSLSGKFAIRKDNWKLILTTDGGGGWDGLSNQAVVSTPAKTVQLYDLEADPGETRNLEDTHPEKINELVQELAQAFANGRTTPGSAQANEGWPYLHQPTMKQFPALAEPNQAATTE